MDNGRCSVIHFLFNKMKSFLEFFKRQFVLVSVSGIPVRIDFRWVLVVIIMSWLTAINIPNSLVDNYLTKIILAVLTTLIFFLSIFGHELAHAIAARLEGIETLEIVLHPFGGLARLRREPDNPRAEFRIAIAGPIASFVFSFIFLGCVFGSQSLGLFALSPFFRWLAFLNLMLAVFNLFPGYPLDGGRVLRAFLWKRGYELSEATILTGKCGQMISIALIVFCVFGVIAYRELFGGLWTILVGVFLLDSASGIIRQIKEIEELTVEEAMTVPAMIAPETIVQQFVDKTLPLFRQSVFLVAKDKFFYGILVLEDLKALPREKWRQTTIQKIMRPVTEEFFVEMNAPLQEAREMMRENGIGAVGVVDGNGNLVGFLQRGKIRKRK